MGDKELTTGNRVYLPTSDTCFVCGEENHAGLKSRFYVEDNMVKMPLQAQLHHCGYKDTVHGGIVAAALDECMGWAAARAIGRMCVTGELTVRYLRRVPHETDLVVCAETVKSHRRMVTTVARIIDAEDTVYARAEARFLPLSPEESLMVDDNLNYRDGDERIFDTLRNEIAPDSGR